MTKRDSPAGGFALVALGSALWGTDALFRQGLASDLSPTALVFSEHVVLVAATLPVLWRGRSELEGLSRSGWLAALVVGAGSSALATVLFTAAFRVGDPTTPLLLQKAQPLIAVTAAHLILGERLLPRFVWFLLTGLAGAYLIAFPDPTSVSVESAAPALLAAGAATLWGLGTVLGRRLSEPLRFRTLAALRFAIGLPAAGILLIASPHARASLATLATADIGAIVLLAMIPGLAALLLYYRGLRSTPASAATLGEFAFPLTAIAVGYFALDTPLTASQLLGALLLTATISLMTWLGRRGGRALGIDSDRMSALGSSSGSGPREGPRAQGI